MRILLLAESFNSLTQRLYVELAERGHELSVELDVHEAVTREAVDLFDPEVVLAPFLKRAIPEDVWRARRCLIVHPGVPGDRGPSALDWAILEGASRWGVTVLEAEAQMDAGPIWAHAGFAMRQATKSSLYRAEVADAAVEAVLVALARIESGSAAPVPIERIRPPAAGRARSGCRAADRAIDWRLDSTEAVLRKIRSADGSPGVVDALFGRSVRLFDAHPAPRLHGEPGAVIARSGGALARATGDGAVWIGHVREGGGGPGPRGPQGARGLASAGCALKLPAALVFADESRELPVVHTDAPEPIRYEEDGPVGLLHFELYNGAMSTSQCEALRAAYASALERPTRVLVLMGGPDCWSNGIHLAVIEAAESPAEESWRNINAIDDLARDVLHTTDRIVIAALRGGAGAGGVFLALAADEVWAAPGVVLNPHYKDMGNLYGSEYWTYLLPRRVGLERASAIMRRRLPLGVPEASRLGLVDRVLAREVRADPDRVRRLALALALDGSLAARIIEKRSRRDADERIKPLEAYRAEELAQMHRNFYGFDTSYHVARYNFIHKVPKSHTPLHLARHRVPHRKQERTEPAARGGAVHV